MIFLFQTSFVFSPLFFCLYFLIFFVNFAPSLPLHASICQQTIPRRFRPVLSLFCCFIFKFHFVFVFCFFYFISEFSWDSVFFCFFLFVLEGLVFLVLSPLVGRGLGFPAAHPRLFDHVMKMDWQERVIAAAVWAAASPRLASKEPRRKWATRKSSLEYFLSFSFFFWIQPRHW